MMRAADLDLPTRQAPNLPIWVTRAGVTPLSGAMSATSASPSATAPRGWVVTVADDGVGLPETAPAPTATSGLGTRLVEAFVRQAEGTITTDSDRTGTRVELVLEG